MGRLLKDSLSVLFIAGRLAPWKAGGPSQVQSNLVNNLTRLPGFDVSVLGTIPRNARGISNFYNQVTVLPVQTTTRSGTFIDILMSILLYPYKSTKRKYDIIHFGITPGIRGSTSVLANGLLSSGSKLVATIHGAPEELKLYDFPTMRRIAATADWKLTFKSLSLFDCIVVNSNIMKERVRRIVSNKAIVVIPNGIEESLLKREPSKYEKNVILCYGSLNPIKGQDLLIRAFARSRVSSTHKLVLVGDGSHNFRKYCETLSQEMHLQDKVLFIGHLNHDQLFPLVEEAKVCVFPSRLESFGIGTLEAMALGRPVIATRLGGPIDFVTDNEDGILLNPNDTVRMAASLEAICSDSHLRRRLGENARKKAASYSWPLISLKYATLYESL